MDYRHHAYVGIRMRNQDQSSDTDKRDTAGARGSRKSRGARTAGPVPAIAMNHAVASRSPRAILALQRAAGNAAVVQLVEQERHVHDGGCGHQQGEGHPVQRSGVDQVLRSSGTPIAGPVRRDMEARLGADFSDVRLHSDASARRSAAEVGARAYTSGSHVVIGEGGGDSRTLAHELIHVIQQRRGPVAGTDNGSGLRVSDPSDRFEREAEAGAARAMSATPVRTADGPVGAAVQRAVAGGAAVQRAGDLGIAVQRAKKGPKPGSGAGKAGKAAADEAPAQVAFPDELSSLMDGADRQDLGDGSGVAKYKLPSIGRGVDPKALYRAMGKAEFDSLRAGTLSQGGSFQGFSTTRNYSEGYVTGSAGSHTHLVEFYRPERTGPDGKDVLELNEYLQAAGAPTKNEDGIVSTAIGETAPYRGKVPENTRKNEAREERIGKLTSAVEDARAKLADPKLRARKERELAEKEPLLAELKAKPAHYPAKGDAVKALNRGLAEGRYAWRLVTLKSA